MPEQSHAKAPPHNPGKDHQIPNPTPPVATEKESAAAAQAKHTQEVAAGCNSGLAALDETIRRELKIAGPPGSGLFMLLDNLAVSTLGTKRSAFPTPASNNPGDYYRQQAPLPGVPGTSPPGPLPGAGAGQSPNANSSAPLNQ